MVASKGKISPPAPPVNGRRGQPATYQTRISDFADMDRASGNKLLSAYADRYCGIQRRLFADVAAGRSAVSLKPEYLRRYRIPARMFNAVRVSLEGKVASVREQQLLRRDELLGQIARAQDRMAQEQTTQAGEGARGDWLHQKRRRLEKLRGRLERLELDIQAGRIRLCFGSRRLWRKQHNLEANGYSCHEKWLSDWRSARSDEFFVLGSKDETAGCQLCVALVADDGSLTLRLRLPDCLAGEQGKYLVIPGVRFKYGHEQVLAALDSNAEYGACRRRHGEKAARQSGLGQAVSYRFKRDARGWRVFLTTALTKAPVVTDRSRGAIGVDLNADHLAVSETDASGNPVNCFSVPLVTYGKSRRQAEAIIGDAVADVVAHAREVGKPIVLEKLDFRQKKAGLEGASPRYSRMLSSFSYARIKACFLSRGIRQGVEVYQVNPAFSSVIGRVKFMERYGLSAHQAAALALARRFLGCSEGIPRLRVAPLGNGVRVAFSVPARKRVKHVWTLWGCVLGQLRPVLAAQYRLGKRRRRPNPVRAPA
ncbi:MAG: IS200/IS605 family accessory protein TnpB-related protein [Chloroflexota bacterium]|nr:IS200/IS605 family accessory protein TnpB-related protein [Chloroflexota bacterium]